jgi:3-phenylpropionate/cinnamic acid dioxygenase small subunit
MQGIEELIVAYAHDIDDGLLDGWPAYFTQDGTYTILTRENLADGLPMGIMYCQGRGMMADRIKAMQTANIFEKPVTEIGRCRQDRFFGTGIISNERTGTG